MSFDVEMLVRIVAAVAALALVASPMVVASSKVVWAWLYKTPVAPSGEIGIDEMRLVLDLAARLRVAGSSEGVALCQQLIDVMLKRGAKS